MSSHSPPPSTALSPEGTLRERHDAHVFYTWTAQKQAQPLPIVRAEGAEFWTDDGKRWIDFESQVFNANLGHGNRKVIEAIKAQADSLCVAHPAAVFPAKVALGERLASICPPDVDRFFFCLGGAEAVENAVKIARMATGRHKVVTRWRSYHGATYGAATLGGDPRRHPHEPGISGVVRVEDPYCYRCPFGQQLATCARECASHLERIVEYEGPSQIAAILLEPIVGAAGGYIPPQDYLQRVRKLCDKYGILLVADEVFMGFGRTGRWFSHEHFGVAPDLITMGKGITGGYAPLGAVAVRRSVAEYFDHNTLWTGLTSYGHPLGCAAAVAAVDAYREERLIERAAHFLEPALQAHLRHLEDRHPHVHGGRVKGAYAVFELVKNRETKEPLAPFNAQGAALAPIAPLKRRLQTLGLHVSLRWHQIIVAPPLTISETLLTEGFERLSQALEVLSEATP